MPDEIRLQIGKDGTISMLHDDRVDLSQFGEVEVRRASHVEFSDGRNSMNRFGQNIPRGWFVMSASTGALLAYGFSTRTAALAWEKTHYSPGGAGWAELDGEALR